MSRQICNKDMCCFDTESTVLTRQTHNACKVCEYRAISEYDHEYCYNCATRGTKEFAYHHKNCEDFPSPPRLRRELSLPYAYPDDAEVIDVPLRFRLKYDRVVDALKNSV